MSKRDAYKSLEIYQLSKKLAIACYELTQDLPEDEKTNFSRYIREAALNVHINIAQTVFLRWEKRKKFIHKARVCLVVIDTATEILVEVGFVSQEDADEVFNLSSLCCQLLEKQFKV